MKSMLGLEEAIDEILAAISPLPPRSMELRSAGGLVLSAGILSDIDMPPFDRSAVDGYALAGEHDGYLLTGAVATGGGDPHPLGPGEAAYINTGAPVPSGADRILMVEHSEASEGRVRALSMPAAGDNVCRRAEDVRAGDMVLPSRKALSPQDLGIAAMAGMSSLDVHPRPLVGVITTGSEVVPPGALPGPSQVRNANLPLLEGLLSSCGFTVKEAIHSDDDHGSLSSAVRRALSSSDALLIAGGISMGEMDMVAPVLGAAGVEFVFRDVAIKPGKPLAFGMMGSKPVFALPGNPVSVLCTFEELVLPGLRRLCGLRAARKARFEGTAAFRHSQKPGRANLLRVMATAEAGGWLLRMPSSSGSGDLRSTRDTNALAIVPSEAAGAASGDMLAFSFYASSIPSICFE